MGSKSIRCDWRAAGHGNESEQGLRLHPPDRPEAAAGVRLLRVLGPQEMPYGDGPCVILDEPAFGEVAWHERAVESAAVGQRTDAAMLVHEIEAGENETRIVRCV